jgi:hypothetical protein
MFAAALLTRLMCLLAARHWMHSEMWWPRLFAGGPTIEWDDYEKDYSDLPAPVLAAHQVRLMTAGEAADIAVLLHVALWL